MKTFLVSICCFLSVSSYADCCIEGNMNPAPGATETYTVDWGYPAYYLNYANIYWNVSGGTVLSFTKTRASCRSSIHRFGESSCSPDALENNCVNCTDYPCPCYGLGFYSGPRGYLRSCLIGPCYDYSGLHCWALVHRRF